jgi:ribosomal-protein-alanine N-acetyltransferase
VHAVRPAAQEPAAGLAQVVVGPPVAELRTDRLLLRRWRASDRAPFARLNADPEVMRYFPSPLSAEENDAFMEQMEMRLERDGWGLWALEVRQTRAFIGFTGLASATFEAHFTPAIEIGWRLAREAWGCGYATEAARAAARFGFEELQRDELVSFTATGNAKSRAVMRRLGMTHDPAEDFDHPRLAIGDPLRRHVLYRLTGPCCARSTQTTHIGHGGFHG